MALFWGGCMPMWSSGEALGWFLLSKSCARRDRSSPFSSRPKPAATGLRLARSLFYFPCAGKWRDQRREERAR